MVSTPQERKLLIQGVIVVGAGLAVPQVLAYAASVIAARLLVPAEFGAFGAMQGITQIANPIGLAIQAIVARKMVKNFRLKTKITANGIMRDFFRPIAFSTSHFL